MANVMLEILGDFSLVWVLVYTGIQSPRFNKWLLILNWSKWILIVNIVIQILLTLLTIIDLPILRKIICRKCFLFGVSYYVNF